MDLKRVRKGSLKQARRLGYPVNRALPLLDPPTAVKPVEQALGRAVALHAAIWAAFGMDRTEVSDYLKRGNLEPLLAADERSLLAGQDCDPEAIRIRVEALWALGWALGLVKQLDHSDYCGDELERTFPRPSPESDPAALRPSAALRSVEELVSASDLLYCLHWAVEQASIDRAVIPGKVRAYVIAERRRAVDWLLGADDWDDVPMDT